MPMPAQSKAFQFISKLFLFFLSSSLLAVVFWPFSQPTLYIDTRSRETAGNTQLFYKRTADGDYSGDQVRNHPMAIGRQLLSYDLPNFYSPLRWDPPNQPGDYEVYAMWLQIGWSRWNIDWNLLSAGPQIKTIRAIDAGIVINTDKTAFDPQIIIDIPKNQIDNWRIAVSAITAYLVMALLWFLWAYHLQFATWNGKAEQAILKAKTWLQKEAMTLAEFGTFALIVLMLNLYSLSSFAISIDNEYAAFRALPDIWIADGRWTTYLVERFVFPQPIMPYVPNFVFSLLVALSYMFLIRAHHVQRSWQAYITFPVFCTFPVWWFITQFYSNLPSIGLGTLLISISIFIFSRIENDNHQGQLHFIRKNLTPILAQSILLAFAIGTYQSFIMFYLAMGTGVILIKVLQNPTNAIQNTVQRILKLAMVVGLGFVIYSAISNTALFLSPRDGSTYLGGFWQLEKLTQDPLQVIEIVLLEMRAFYTGATGKYGDVIFGIGMVIVASALSLLFQTSRPKLPVLLIIFALWILLLASPFLLNFASGGIMPTRTMLPIAYVIWVLVLIIMNRAKSSTILAGVSLVIILVLQVQILRTNGMYAAVSFIAQEHDRMLAADIYRRISETDPEFSRHQHVRVDIYGTKSVETAYGAPWSSTMGASFFDWDSGNPGRMLNFMRLMGYQKLTLLPNEQRIEMTPIFETMPAWPAAGSVQRVDDVVLIKLGNKPDDVHALYSPE